MWTLGSRTRPVGPGLGAERDCLIRLIDAALTRVCGMSPERLDLRDVLLDLRLAVVETVDLEASIRESQASKARDCHRDLVDCWA
jgi:hypothetical protein